MSDLTKKILISVASVVAFVMVVIALCVGTPWIYFGITIAALTGLCIGVWLGMKLADMFKKYSEKNAQYKTAMEVMFWLGFWWTYVIKVTAAWITSFVNARKAKKQSK